MAQVRSGFLSRTDNVWVVGDGSAIWQRSAFLDIARNIYLPRRLVRKETAFFDGCLQETDPGKLYACLDHWWVEGLCFPADSLPCPLP